MLVVARAASLLSTNNRNNNREATSMGRKAAREGKGNVMVEPFSAIPLKGQKKFAHYPSNLEVPNVENGV